MAGIDRMVEFWRDGDACLDAFKSMYLVPCVPVHDADEIIMISESAVRSVRSDEVQQTPMFRITGSSLSKAEQTTVEPSCPKIY